MQVRFLSPAKAEVDEAVAYFDEQYRYDALLRVLRYPCVVRM
jgi:hypothetical protein